MQSPRAYRIGRTSALPLVIILRRGGSPAVRGDAGVDASQLEKISVCSTRRGKTQVLQVGIPCMWEEHMDKFHNDTVGGILYVWEKCVMFSFESTRYPLHVGKMASTNLAPVP